MEADRVKSSKRFWEISGKETEMENKLYYVLLQNGFILSCLIYNMFLTVMEKLNKCRSDSYN